MCLIDNDWSHIKNCVRLFPLKSENLDINPIYNEKTIVQKVQKMKHVIIY